MAKRPVFLPAPDEPTFVHVVTVDLTWNPGFAVAQKKKNIRALHNAAAALGYSPLLEISTKADEKLGQHLSAFHLKVRGAHGEMPLESAFQGSKVFQFGGPHHELYRVDARTAKRDPRLQESGRIVGFEFDGFRFPTEPKTAFYDWLYINAIAEHATWLKPRLTKYVGFTDIEFNPERSVNCQARSCALFVALLNRNLLESAIESPSRFLDICLEQAEHAEQAARVGPPRIPDFVDQLGEWSQIKHEILDKYAHAYTTIVTQQPVIKKVLYIDAYAGSGFGVDRETGQQLRGSAMRALAVTPRFDELHFVEQDDDKAAILEQATSSDLRVTVHRGDSVSTLMNELLPRCRWEDFHRALCLLDPYDLSIPFTLLQRIGGMRSVEVFYNFMIMDANRNVLWSHPEDVPPERLAKMDLVWGDRTWQEACYAVEPDLFGGTLKKQPNEAIAEAFRRRLQTVAGFKYVPPPIAMKNSTNATVYYLYFASPNETGASIVKDVFKNYRR